MDESNQTQETYMDRLHPAVREGIRRSFAELDVQAPDFEEKAESMIEQFLEMQFKDVIKEWKKADRDSKGKPETIDMPEIFDKIAEEVSTELKSAMMKSSGDKALIEDKISSIERDIKEYNGPIKRIIKQQDREIYVQYLMYKKDQAEEESHKYKEEIDTNIKELTKCKEDIDTNIKELTKCKEDIDTNIKEITKNKERIAKVEEEISKLRKQILEEEEFLRIGTEYLETLKEKEQKSIELVETLRKKEQKSIELVETLRKKEQKSIELVELLRQKEQTVTRQIKFMQIIYNDYLGKLDFIKEELREEAEYLGIPIPETNTGTLEDRKIPEEAGILEEGNLPEKIEEQKPTITGQEQILEIKEESTEIDNNEKNVMPENEDMLTEELKTNPLFQQIQDITERAIQAQTPKELFEASVELESMYLKRRNNPEKKNEMDKIMSKIPDSIGILKIGEFYMRARKKYIKLTGKDNPTEEDKIRIENIREAKDALETYLQEKFPGQKINLPTLENEEVEIKPSFRQIQNIIERGRQAETPREFTKISTELARPYIKIRGNVEQKGEMEKLLGAFPEGINMLKVGLFQINTRKKYMRLTGKENPSKAEQELIKNMKDKSRAQVERILQDRFPEQNIDVPPLRTEKEYIAELKGLESKNLSENRNNQDIITQITQIYSELTQVISELKQDKIQKIYNRIIRGLKGRPGVDNTKVPPTLKESVVQKIETPLPNYDTMFTHDENRHQHQGDDVGESGPSME